MKTRWIPAVAALIGLAAGSATYLALRISQPGSPAPAKLALAARPAAPVLPPASPAPPSAGAPPLSPPDAPQHIGETATVCGVVASAKYLDRSKTKPTFLNLGEPYPDEIFTVVIFGDDRPKFGTPEATLNGRRVCVTGKIKEYRGVPEIILADPQQLKQ